jgi:hypothetical protein
VCIVREGVDRVADHQRRHDVQQVRRGDAVVLLRVPRVRRRDLVLDAQGGGRRARPRRPGAAAAVVSVRAFSRGLRLDRGTGRGSMATW